MSDTTHRRGNVSIGVSYLLDSLCPHMECAKTMVIDVICSMRDCEKYVQHLNKNLKNYGTGSALLPDSHRLKLEFIVFIEEHFEFFSTGLLLSILSEVQETLSFFRFKPWLQRE